MRGEKLQDFVKQQQDYERGERDKIAVQDKEKEIERDRIAAQEKERADKLAAQCKDREFEEAKADKDRELERDRIAVQDKDRKLEEAKIAANERLETARIEGIAEQAERDRELKQTELETDKESKLSSEIELFEIRKIAEYFLWLSLPGDCRVTDEALLAETT